MSDAVAQPATTEHHDHPKVPYVAIFATLVVMTVATVLISFVDLGSKPANVSVAMLLASFKASLVMFFFMHLKYERGIMKFIAFAPFVLATVLVFALFPDVVFGQRPPNPTPVVSAEHH